MRRRYNQPGFDVFDYDIYAVCGDGCLMEGVGSEAASLAGHLGLDNLCWIYDNNHITIEGSTQHRVHRGRRGALPGLRLERAARRRCERHRAHRECAADVSARRTGRPTLIILDSHIGYGSPHRQDTAAAHGEPLGVDEVRLTKRAYGWPEDAQFLVPDGVREHFAAGIGARGAEAHAEWNDLFAAYARSIRSSRREIEQMQRRELAGGMGPQPAGVRRRCEGCRRAATRRARC